MPTGYTAMIADGATFEEFVWKCARNFGALVTMRDDPWDAPIPERFEVFNWHNEQRVAAEQELATVSQLSSFECQKRAKTEYDAAMKKYSVQLAEQEKLRSKYIQMLKKVEAWSAPSQDHVGLKSFMREQIERSIEFDCYALPIPQLLDGLAWKAKKLTDLNWSISYHGREQNAEEKRVAVRNRWLTQLRESVSLPAKVVAAKKTCPSS